MEQRPKRKRFNIGGIPQTAVPVIVDEEAFRKNRCSDNAKKVFTQVEEITIELWHDKHYHDRRQHGDEQGKRADIDADIVEDLVRRSFKHLLFYSSMVKGFTFLNTEAVVGQPHRIILQQDYNESVLNVVIQAHFTGINCFEITVITAMCVDSFRIAHGQYVVEIQGDNSILKKYDNKALCEIASF
jgi:hypothetical protein